MKVGLTGTGVLALAGLAVAGVVAFVVWRKGGGLVDSVTGAISDAGDALNLGAARARSAVVNTFTPGASGGDPVRAALYGDAGYTGTNPDGSNITDSDWWGSSEARRYSYTTRDAAVRAGLPPPVESQGGAAFGIYPGSGRDRTPVRAPPGRETQPGFGEVVGRPRLPPIDDSYAEDQTELVRMQNRWRAGHQGAPSGEIRTGQWIEAY
jgi:hypothetical protein